MWGSWNTLARAAKQSLNQAASVASQLTKDVIADINAVDEDDEENRRKQLEPDKYADEANKEQVDAAHQAKKLSSEKDRLVQQQKALDQQRDFLIERQKKNENPPYSAAAAAAAAAEETEIEGSAPPSVSRLTSIPLTVDKPAPCDDISGGHDPSAEEMWKREYEALLLEKTNLLREKSELLEAASAENAKRVNAAQEFKEMLERRAQEAAQIKDHHSAEIDESNKIAAQLKALLRKSDSDCAADKQRLEAQIVKLQLNVQRSLELNDAHELNAKTLRDEISRIESEHEALMSECERLQKVAAESSASKESTSSEQDMSQRAPLEGHPPGGVPPVADAERIARERELIDRAAVAENGLAALEQKFAHEKEAATVREAQLVKELEAVKASEQAAVASKKDLKQRLTELSSATEKLGREYSRAREELNTAATTMETLRKENAVNNATIESRHQQEHVLRDDLANAISNRNAAETKLLIVTAELEKERAQSASGKDESKQSGAQSALRLQNELAKKDAELAASKATLSDLRRELNDSMKRNREQETAMTQTDIALLALKRSNEEVSVTMKQKNAQLAGMNSSLQEAQTSLADARAEAARAAASAKLEIAEKARQEDQMRTEVLAFRVQISALESENASLRRKAAAVDDSRESKLTDTAQQLAEAGREIEDLKQTLRTNLDKLNEEHGRSESLLNVNVTLRAELQNERGLREAAEAVTAKNVAQLQEQMRSLRESMEQKELVVGKLIAKTARISELEAKLATVEADSEKAMASLVAQWEPRERALLHASEAASKENHELAVLLSTAREHVRDLESRLAEESKRSSVLEAKNEAVGQRLSALGADAKAESERLHNEIEQLQRKSAPAELVTQLTMEREEAIRQAKAQSVALIGQVQKLKSEVLESHARETQIQSDYASALADIERLSSSKSRLVAQLEAFASVRAADATERTDTQEALENSHAEIQKLYTTAELLKSDAAERESAFAHEQQIAHDRVEEWRRTADEAHVVLERTVAAAKEDAAAYESNAKALASRIAELESESDVAAGVSKELAECRAELRSRERDYANASTALSSLQAMFDQLHAEKVKAESANALTVKTLREEITKLQSEANTLRMSDRNAEELKSNFLRTRETLIAAQKYVLKLETENAQLRKGLESTMSELQNSTNDTDVVDRRLVVKLLETFLLRPNGQKRDEVVDLMMRLLQFSQDQKDRIFELRRKQAQSSGITGASKVILQNAWNWIQKEDITYAPQALATSASALSIGEGERKDKNLADLWVDFLLSEADRVARVDSVAAGSRKPSAYSGFGPQDVEIAADSRAQESTALLGVIASGTSSLQVAPNVNEQRRWESNNPQSREGVQIPFGKSNSSLTASPYAAPPMGDTSLPANDGSPLHPFLGAFRQGPSAAAPANPSGGPRA